MSVLGNTLFIVNPRAHNGEGREIVNDIKNIGRYYCEDYAVGTTRWEHHARKLAREARGFDTIVSVGGDGNARDTVWGLMERPEDNRPAFSLLPYGSGNDYARTLSIPLKIKAALDAISNGKICRIDVGRCNDTYFCESASFGIDAAIALRTISLREETNKTGTRLYYQAGQDILKNHFETIKATYQLDGNPAQTQETLIFCLTIGATYGGGFKIAPKADPCDGKFDIHMTDAISPGAAKRMFAAAVKGLHTRSKGYHHTQAARCTVDFPYEPPAQLDGDKLEGTHFEFEIVPAALRVVVPQKSTLPLAD